VWHIEQILLRNKINARPHLHSQDGCAKDMTRYQSYEGQEGHRGKKWHARCDAGV
jgi:hypothetical protein